jgi:hypothetical protein
MPRHFDKYSTCGAATDQLDAHRATTSKQI